MRIGIIFGGSSREREVSFAGGRTVYDNLNKALFEPFPIFVDSFGNWVLLDWQYIYKGSIRDFYPPVKFLDERDHDFQIYAESLSGINSTGKAGHSKLGGTNEAAKQLELLEEIGKPIPIGALKAHIDFAFLTLHGENGEDGRIQGLLEYEGIPYSGSGIYACSLGMDKVLQKTLMREKGFFVPAFTAFTRQEWISGNERLLYEQAQNKVGFPLVVKSSRQGSSIGVTVVMTADFDQFREAVDQSLFRRVITQREWLQDQDGKEAIIKEIGDFRQGPGLPVKVDGETVYHPSDLYDLFQTQFAQGASKIVIESIFQENAVLIESFIAGKEFSCIVLDDTLGNAVALPPTEIRKFTGVYDYRSKYLPGLSRKITPIDLPDDQIRAICQESERLFAGLGFEVYARIDGFITEDRQIILNDPNTTSGMLPSSFFFHQAAEIGLNPSQFLTYIIYSSLIARLKPGGYVAHYEHLLSTLSASIATARAAELDRKTVVVIFGGYSSERHISVESGRNIYEKLSSGVTYKPLPVFLTGASGMIRLYQVPVNLLLKDNADDISEKILTYHSQEVIEEIILKARPIISLLGAETNLVAPREVSFDELAANCDAAFIALHGRPGEDGELQADLERVGLPYNGSGIEASRITIDKYRTNEILSKAGILTARHSLFSAADWAAGPQALIERIENGFDYPFIAKPVDDGCSSAVKKITDRLELEAFLKLIFRRQDDLDAASAAVLDLAVTEEFPIKSQVLIEELITAHGADRFMEITGGLLTTLNETTERVYQVFEPSEVMAGTDVLSLEEKFLAGEGQNITPPRYSPRPADQKTVGDEVKQVLKKVARLLNIEGYCRIDAFVRVFGPRAEVIIIEVNSLPGMTPATAIFHQAALDGLKPAGFINRILDYALKNKVAGRLAPKESHEVNAK